MSTRSRIGVMQPDGSVQSIYVHWDGCLQGVGTTLLRSYNDPSPAGDERRSRLLDLGSLSVLGDNLDPAPGAPHSFDDPQEDVCVAYKRDRGETDGTMSDTHSRVAWPSSWQEYEYLWDSGKWLWRRCQRTDRSWRPLGGA